MRRPSHPAQNVGVGFGWLANTLTMGRIALALIMLCFEPLSAGFYILYSLCGLTDILDGAAARRMNAQSRFGAALDSVADMVFMAAAVWLLYRPIISVLPQWAIWAAGGIALVRLSAYAAGAARYKRFLSRHTLMNKAAGCVLFAAPYFVLFIDARIILTVVCASAGVSAVEELMMNVFTNNCDPNAKSIFLTIHKGEPI